VLIIVAKPKVSVIIPVYNRPIQVVHCIGSVKKQDYEEKEIIVVDDGSTDNTWEVIKRISGLLLVKNKKRLGPGAARNRGIEASNGEIIVFLDSDCQAISKKWLTNHVLAHNSAEDKIVSGKVIGKHSTYGGGVFSYVNWFMFMGKKGIISASYVPMANLSALRTLFDRVGLFNTTMPVYEDVDWSFRAKALDIDFMLIDNATAYHKDREGLKKVFKHQKCFGMWSIPLRMKHPQSKYSWLFPKTLIWSIIMYIPLSLLMTLYIIIIAINRFPQIIFYAPGILFTQFGYFLGVIQFFLSEKNIKDD